MIKVSKYHGLGNDFVMVDYVDVEQYDLSTVAKVLCDRHTSIGGDGFIAVKESPLEMIYYNSDGSRAEMCGNGIRCFAKYVIDHEFTKESNITVKTLAGDYDIMIVSTEPFLVKVNMGTASYTSTDLGIKDNQVLRNHTLKIEEKNYTISSLLMGVPHTVIEHDISDVKEITRLGSLIEQHELFTKNTNVNFYNVLSKDTIEMITFERGAGLTLACGTGATATFSHLLQEGVITTPCTAKLPLGDLTFEQHNNDIYMIGPSEKIMDAFMNLEALL